MKLSISEDIKNTFVKNWRSYISAVIDYSKQNKKKQVHELIDSSDTDIDVDTDLGLQNY